MTLDQPSTADSYPTSDEREALALEFQRLTAQLVRAGLLSRTSALRLVQGVHRARRNAPEERSALPSFLFDFLIATEDGTLAEGVHFVRCAPGRLALHVDSVVSSLHRAGRTSLGRSEARRLLRFGRRFFGSAVVKVSERVRFRGGERRRATVLDLARTEKLLGGKPHVLFR